MYHPNWDKFHSRNSLCYLRYCPKQKKSLEKFPLLFEIPPPSKISHSRLVQRRFLVTEPWQGLLLAWNPKCSVEFNHLGGPFFSLHFGPPRASPSVPKTPTFPKEHYTLDLKLHPPFPRPSSPPSVPSIVSPNIRGPLIPNPMAKLYLHLHPRFWVLKAPTSGFPPYQIQWQSSTFISTLGSEYCKPQHQGVPSYRIHWQSSTIRNAHDPEFVQ